MIIDSTIPPFIAELIKAANTIHNVTIFERARLLKQAAETIREYRKRIDFSGEPAETSADIVTKLEKAAREIEAISNESVAAVLLAAAGIIKTLRILLETKYEVILEDAPPAGSA